MTPGSHEDAPWRLIVHRLGGEQPLWDDVVGLLSRSSAATPLVWEPQLDVSRLGVALPIPADFFCCVLPSVVQEAQLGAWQPYLDVLARLKAHDATLQTVFIAREPAAAIRAAIASDLPSVFHRRDGRQLEIGDPHLLLTTPLDSIALPQQSVAPFFGGILLGSEAREMLGPDDLPADRLFGPRDFQFMTYEGDMVRPAQWFRAMAQRFQLPAEIQHQLGLVRQEDELILVEGLPLEEIDAMTLGRVRFDHLLSLPEASPPTDAERRLQQRQLQKLCVAFQERLKRHRRWYRLQQRELRFDEYKLEQPVYYHSTNPALSGALRGVLRHYQFQQIAPYRDRADLPTEAPAVILDLEAAPPPGLVNGGGSLGPGGEHRFLRLGREGHPLLQKLTAWDAWSQLPPTDGLDAQVQAALDAKSAAKQLAKRLETLTGELEKLHRARMARRHAWRRGRAQRDLDARRQALRARFVELLTALLSGPAKAQMLDAALLPFDRPLLILVDALSMVPAEVLAYDARQQKLGTVHFLESGSWTSEGALHGLTREPALATHQKQKTLFIEKRTFERLQKLAASLQEAWEQAAVSLREQERKLDTLRQQQEAFLRDWSPRCLAGVQALCGGFLVRQEASLTQAIEVLHRQNMARRFPSSGIQRVAVFASHSASTQTLRDACLQTLPQLEPEAILSLTKEMVELQQITDFEQKRIDVESGASSHSLAARQQVERRIQRQFFEEKLHHFCHDVLRQLVTFRAQLVLVAYPFAVAEALTEAIKGEGSGAAAAPDGGGPERWRGLEAYRDALVLRILPDHLPQGSRPLARWPWVRSWVQRGESSIPYAWAVRSLAAFFEVPPPD